MKRRPSILLYFDNYHLISHLPDDQLALLFRSFMEFSEQEVNGGGASIADYQRRYPAMGETARAYFAFMADNVRRDAAVYREKCANYSAAGLQASDGVFCCIYGRNPFVYPAAFDAAFLSDERSGIVRGAVRHEEDDAALIRKNRIVIEVGQSF